MAKIVYYGIEDPDRRDTLLRVAKSMDIETRAVEEDEIGELVGYLAGLEGYEKTRKTAEPIQEEMLLFVSLSSEALQNMLLALRKEGEIFPHKAALTETSKDWTFAYLLHHIQRENAVVNAWSQMLPLVKEALKKQEDAPSKEREEAIEASKALRLKGDDLEEEDVLAVIEQLKKAL